MALNLSELLEAQAALREKEEKAAAPKESMSMSQLKELASAAKPERKQAKTDGAIVKIFQEVKRHTGLLEQIARISQNQAALNSRENMQEQQRLMERVAGALEDIRENTEPKKADKIKDDKGISLGGIGTALALALGGLVGAIQGYVKGLKVVGSALYKGIVWVSDFFPSFKKMLFNIEATFLLGFDLIKDAFKTFSGKIVKVFDGALDFIKNFFGGGEKMAGIAKVFAEVKTAITGFFAPIVDAFKVIQETSGPIGKAVSFVKDSIGKIFTFFSELGSKISAFSKMFGAFATIAKNLVMPLTVIMTIWDTVSNVIDRFSSDGVIGAIVGVVEGLFNSIIAAPADLLKSVVSWILGAFGFEKAEKFLDSFSFVDIVKGFVDAILRPIETIKKMFSGVLEGIQEIHIPKIGFTIPIIDKEVSIGPFYPFKKEGAVEAAPAKETAGGAVEAAPAKEAAQTASFPVGRPGSPSWNFATRRSVPQQEASGTERAIAPTPAEAATTTPTPAQLPIKEGQPQPVTISTEKVVQSVAEGKPIPLGPPAPVEAAAATENAPIREQLVQPTPMQQQPQQPQVSKPQDATGAIGSVLSGATSLWSSAINIGKGGGGALPLLGAIGQGVGGVLSGATTLWDKAINVGKQPTTEASAVYEQSAMNADAARAPAPSQNVVVAPQTTNVQNNQTSIMRIPSRNNDTSVSNYLKERYAY